MAIEFKKDTAVLVTNVVVAVGILVLCGLRVIDWKMAVGGLTLLLVPSVAGAKKDDDDEPPKPGNGGLPTVMTPIIGAAILLSGCALFTAKNAKTVLSVIDVACIIAHAETDDATVAQICAIDNALANDLRAILAEQRKAVAKAKRSVAACGPAADGGAP